MRKEFKDFLKQEGCYDKYVENLKAGRTKECFEWYYELQGEDLNSPITDMRAAFDFTDSPEGFDFWLGIADKWSAVVRGMNFTK